MAFPKIFKVNFGEDGQAALHKYVKDKVDYISAINRELRESLLPKWVRIYRGTPYEKEATMPWKGAANLVIQIAGTHCDELLSRVMAIWSTSPLYVAELYGDFDQGQGVDQKEVLEFFLEKMGFEPDELDLYRVEETMFSSTIRYGTGIVKIPYEYLVEQVPVSFSIRDSSQIQFEEIVKRDGPHPEPVPLNLFGIDPKYANLSNADFVYHILKKDKQGILAMRLHPEIYDTDAIAKVLLQPDRDGPDEFTRELQSAKGAEFTAGNECSNEWDIYECWYRYQKDGKNFSFISYYHKLTDTHLGTIYNIYPNNENPFVDAKLAYDDDTYFGFGLCEMLEAYQIEVSKIHNWRRNAKDFAITGIGRVNKNSKLSSIVQLFPGLLIPADEGEIEPLQFGAGAIAADTSEETLTLSLAKERSGVDPAIGGAGGGIVNSKRGIYSAQGTAAVMQQQNNRNNLRMSDMRSAHVRIGRKILNIYSHFGIGAKSKMFGDRAETLLKALEGYKAQKLGLGIKAATASVNRELEKQNDILISQTLERLYAGDAQIIQAITTPGSPPPLQAYYVEVLRAKNALFKHILRNFGRDDVGRLIPVPDFIKENRNGQPINGGDFSQAGNSQTPGRGTIPVGSGSPVGAIPEGNAIQ